VVIVCWGIKNWFIWGSEVYRSLHFQFSVTSRRQNHFCTLLIPQTVNGPSKCEFLGDWRASSVETGDVGTLDSLADTYREHLRLRHLLVGDKSKRSNKVACPFSMGREVRLLLPSPSSEPWRPSRLFISK
jgi:hypothetical protein